MHQNCLAIAAGKGGVLKTSASVHLAGLAAAGGWRVLLIDADPQGNAMFDLGYDGDQGAGLADALARGADLRPLFDVRPGLDVVPGGPRLDTAADGVTTDPDTWLALDRALEPLAEHYDLIVIDSPPRELRLRRMILSAAHFVVIPSGIDRASRLGLTDASVTVREIRATTNPDLDVLAVFAGPISLTSTRIRHRVRRRLGEMIEDPDMVLSTVVRYAPLVAEECRERGLLSGEYADLADNAVPWYEARRLAEPSDAFSRAAGNVAEDWQHLVDEVLARFVSAQRSWAPA